MPLLARPRVRLPFLALCALLIPPLPAAAPAEDYPTHLDSVVRAGVPVGELLKLTFDQSRIFPGTTREVQVYVPRQYDPARPACVHVNQDRIQWNAPVVFDNLIAKGDIPVLIGVFVAPGVVKAADGARALDRFNRSFEYDGLGDAYARFVLEELLPFVEQQRTADGRPLRLSRSGNDRAIAGSSSGAIAAWTAAWERPDAFSRVFSGIGTYVGLRGGDRYPTLVRKFEPRRIRVFLQDGSNDNNIYGGDWWMANQTLQRALEFAGYEVRHVWGEGGHNARHATALFPDALRWLWSGWPQPVGFAAPTRNAVLAAVLIPGGNGPSWAKATASPKARSRCPGARSSSTTSAPPARTGSAATGASPLSARTPSAPTARPSPPTAPSSSPRRDGRRSSRIVRARRPGSSRPISRATTSWSPTMGTST